MSILTDVPQRQRFEDFGERGAFNAWMKYSIAFAVLFCLAAILLVFFMDTKRAPDAKAVEKEKVPEKLPVVADLPMKQKTGSETAAKETTKPAGGTAVKPTKSAPATPKKTTPAPAPSKTTPRKTTTKTH